jgi:crotonobetainyl-CoA:carnitine CoA-transferase CaiB-like acyl-CoA transferase
MDKAQASGALAGITVLALEQAVAAPYCTSRLADAGARVIKVERAEGDFARGYDRAAKGMSSYFAWLNRGKESLAADIKAPADAALLHRILSRADVFVQNLLPGAAARAGFGSDELRARHPRLVTVDISGYGDEGPYAAMKSYDMLVQAETGLASITGGPEAPARVGVSVCDIAAGMYAHQAVLEALIRRGRTGEGASIKVSLFDGMADWMAVPLLFSDYGPGAPRRVGLSHPSVAPYDPFPSADGTPVLISIQNDREWQRFCADVLERPGLAADPDFATNVQRVSNRARMDAIIREGFARHGTEALCARLLAAGIAFARVNSVADFSRHAQLRRVRVQTPAGEIALPAPPPVVDGDRAPALGPVPALDAHGEAIRKEFGA